MRFLATLLLCISSSTTYAISIDIAEVFFEAVVTGASLSPSNESLWNSNLSSPTAALIDLNTTSYAWTSQNPGYVDMTFGDGSSDGIDIYNGAGNDISIFFASAGGHEVTLSLYDNNVLLGSGAFDAIEYTGYCIDLDGSACQDGSPVDIPIFSMHINFDSVAAGITAVDKLRMDVSAGSAVPSLVGAYYATEDSVVVPLPAPLLLFLSGAGLLGLVARKR